MYFLKPICTVLIHFWWTNTSTKTLQSFSYFATLKVLIMSILPPLHFIKDEPLKSKHIFNSLIGFVHKQVIAQST